MTDMQYREIEGCTMAYVEAGEGDPIVFLHGNPASSNLWRNVIPHLAGLGHCLAPDLIGMGDSDKLPDSGPHSYTFVEHHRSLDALLNALGVRRRVTLVVHDWAPPSASTGRTATATRCAAWPTWRHLWHRPLRVTGGGRRNTNQTVMERRSSSGAPADVALLAPRASHDIIGGQRISGGGTRQRPVAHRVGVDWTSHARRRG